MKNAFYANKNGSQQIKNVFYSNKNGSQHIKDVFYAKTKQTKNQKKWITTNKKCFLCK